MNDHELSTMLQEWPATPAPETLEERVFGPLPIPVPWLGKVPAGALAVLGTAAGALVMSVLFMLVPREPAPAPPTPAAPVAAPELPPPAPVPAPARKRKAVPKAVEAPRVTTGVTLPPRVIYNPMPAAPDPAIITSVGLRLRIDKEGRVVSAEFLEGDMALAELAIEAVKEWRYAPEMVNGEAVESSTVVSVTFGPRPRPTKIRR